MEVATRLISKKQSEEIVSITRRSVVQSNRSKISSIIPCKVSVDGYLGASLRQARRGDRHLFVNS